MVHHLVLPNQQFMSWSQMVIVFLLCHWPRGLLKKEEIYTTILGYNQQPSEARAGKEGQREKS
ncbi:hypothetical protein C0J52_22308 [Blattella germanica]|nr:hypothetical protein C0J52_22308 [Blattella germanica]